MITERLKRGEQKMYDWYRQIQIIVDEIDESIQHRKGEAITLKFLSRKLGYSEFHTTRKFKEISGMQFRDYLRLRKLAFALMEVRDSEKSILDIAFDYGYSSHEAFTRAFKTTYGIVPRDYRKKPVPVFLRTKINIFDRYFLGIGEIGMVKSKEDIKIYYVTIPAHKFLHIKNYESNGYWDFWQKQDSIPEQDCDTICGLLENIKGVLDSKGEGASIYSGQIMAYINDPNGKPFCHGVPRAECYGVRLAIDYEGVVPPQMQIMDVPEAEYVVFEHGPFDYEHENHDVEEKINKAIDNFNFTDTAYCFDTSPGRITYFYHDPTQFWKNVKPIRKV
jgi:AraC-like DNA-binding protein